MERKGADRILHEWSAVARSATPPGPPIRAAGPRAVGAGISLVGVSLLAIGLVVALAWLGGRDSRPTVGDTTPPTPTPAVPSPAASESQAPAATAEPTPATPEPTLGPCQRLETPLTWEGAAGQRIATITLTNRFGGTCVIDGLTQVEYADGTKALIAGPVPAGADHVTIGPHSSVTTMVEVGNYCGPAPTDVNIVLRRSEQSFVIIGSPASQADMAVPPCNGPGQPATIQMQPWSRK
jgi:uncharacterized protein DUF4232